MTREKFQKSIEFLQPGDRIKLVCKQPANFNNPDSKPKIGRFVGRSGINLVFRYEESDTLAEKSYKTIEEIILLKS